MSFGHDDHAELLTRTCVTTIPCARVTCKTHNSLHAAGKQDTEGVEEWLRLESLCLHASDCMCLSILRVTPTRQDTVDSRQ